MRNNWKCDLNNSIIAIESIRKTILPKIIKGNILTVEGCNNEILMLLDERSGIDYIRHDNEGLQGIAARVQFGCSYESFTIRYKRTTGTMTEYEKRLKQIQQGYFYPAFTLQAYFDSIKELNLLSISIMTTIDLFKELEENPKVITKSNNQDGNIFKVLFWRHVLNKQAIKIYKPE